MGNLTGTNFVRGVFIYDWTFSQQPSIINSFIFVDQVFLFSLPLFFLFFFSFDKFGRLSVKRTVAVLGFFFKTGMLFP